MSLRSGWGSGVVGCCVRVGLVARRSLVACMGMEFRARRRLWCLEISWGRSLERLCARRSAVVEEMGED